MFNSTLWLTLATLAGLGLGFAREWLLVTSWGAGERSDAFIVALFLPEALRMALAGGLLAAAALPLYGQRDEQQRRRWLNAVSPGLLLIALALWALLALAAPLWVRLIGPGLGEQARQVAGDSLALLAACVPGLMLHALLSIPLQARERFVLVGLGSLMFNLPAVAYLAWRGAASQPAELALACVLGSLLMPLSLLPSAWRLGWRPLAREREHGAARELLGRMGPLLASNLASHGLALLERMVASLLGEGVVTWVNLARKLINLPLIALMNLNQVLLGMMSARQPGARLALLHQGLAAATLFSLPASFGLIAASPTFILWLLPTDVAAGPLPLLLAWFSVPLVFGAWNALLARYAYAAGDTALPLRCELFGGAINALLLLSLPFLFGAPGIALAALGGVITTGLALLQRQGLLGAVRWRQQGIVSVLLLGLAAVLVHPLPAGIGQLLLATAGSALVLAGVVVWLRPWRMQG
ncbi:lipid II flippase MurJ [Pseudomonas sp. AA-38]|uniref:lipid II flippase MurJ n=1 Tax=Pseudomonas sp. AA-38 TaxID=3028807 RepID=UPI0023F99704|nr:lipid II flippase MurJ [Pseudomonas sp. AA-38]